jgi:hypothetical protein
MEMNIHTAFRKFKTTFLYHLELHEKEEPEA